MQRAVGRTAAEIAEHLRSSSPFSISLGLAALNAANAPDADAVADAGASAETLIAELGQGRKAGVHPAFPDIVPVRRRSSVRLGGDRFASGIGGRPGRTVLQGHQENGRHSVYAVVPLTPLKANPLTTK